MPAETGRHRASHPGCARPGRCASVEMRCRTRGRIRSCPGQISRNPPCKSPDLARCDRGCNVRPTQSQLQRTATGNSRTGRLVTKASVLRTSTSNTQGGVRRFLTCPRVVLGAVANQEEKRVSGKFKSWCDGTIPTHPHIHPGGQAVTSAATSGQGTPGVSRGARPATLRAARGCSVFGAGCRAFCRSVRVVVCRCGNIMEPEVEVEEKGN